MTWGFLLVLLGLLDSRSQESPIGIGTGHRLATDLSKFVQIKGGRKVSRVQVDDTSLKDKEYLEFEVLEGEVGSSFCYPVEVWFYGPRFYEYTVCGFLGNDNCNVNDNGISNDNGGETL